jgi:hypothetical protein
MTSSPGHFFFITYRKDLPPHLIYRQRLVPIPGQSLEQPDYGRINPNFYSHQKISFWSFRNIFRKKASKTAF